MLRSGIHNQAWIDLREKHVRRIAETMASIEMEAYQSARFPWPYRRDVKRVVEGLERYRDGQMDALKQWAVRLVGRNKEDRDRFYEFARPRIHDAIQASINRVLADDRTARLVRHRRALIAIAGAIGAGFLAWLTGLAEAVFTFIQNTLLRLSTL